MEGFGVSQNFDRAEECLLFAAKEGNGQSAYQLFIMYSSFPAKKDIIKAYRMLNKALQYGVTHFEVQDKYFKENIDVLMPIFIEIRKPPAELNEKQ